MNYLELAKRRCSMRQYSEQKIENDKITTILECARVAPTGVNYQPHHILVLSTQLALDKLKNCANTFNAPLVMIVCVDSSVSWTRKYDNKSIADIDATIVADHILMSAESLGLGTCWVVSFKSDLLRASYNIPQNLEPVAIITIGYDGTDRTSPDRHIAARKPLQDIITYEKF